MRGVGLGHLEGRDDGAGAVPEEADALDGEEGLWARVRVLGGAVERLDGDEPLAVDAEAIGLGLVVSLLFVEAVGFAAGGFVVPGYIALYLDSPLRLLGTVLAATVTYLCVRLGSRFLLIYGRRSLVFAVLLGFLFGTMTSRLPSIGFLTEEGALTAIGYIIPGLLAYWMMRQGILRTLSAMIVAAVLVRFALIIIHGGSLLETSLL